jgi:hypothetical protein
MTRTAAAQLRSANGDEAILLVRMPQVRSDPWISIEQPFNLGNRHPVLLALGSIAFVPIEN